MFFRYSSLRMARCNALPVAMAGIGALYVSGRSNAQTAPVFHALTMPTAPRAKAETLKTQEIALGPAPLEATYGNQTRPTVSADNRRMAFVESKDGKQRLVLNGKPETWYDSVGSVHFSPDGKRIAYLAEQSGNVIVVMDGKETKTVAGKRGNIALFRPDSVSFVFSVIQPDKEEMLYLDFKSTTAVESINDAVFSPTSRQLLLRVKMNGKAYMLGRDDPSGPYESVRSPQWTKTGNHYAFAAKKSDGWHIVQDGKEGAESFDDIGGLMLVETLRFSPDGEHLAFVATKDGKPAFVLDGKSRNDLPEANNIVWGADSKRLALYFGGKVNMVAAIGGGKDDPDPKPYPFIDRDTIIYSPDSKHLAYVATTEFVKEGTFRTASRCAIVLDGVEQTSFSGGYVGSLRAAHALIFSPDSKRLAHLETIEGRKTRVVVDGQADPTYDQIGALLRTNLTFSPDSKHLAYTAMRDSKYYLVVDGKESSPYDALLFDTMCPEGKPVWDSSESVSIVAYRGETAYRVSVNMSR